MPGLVPTRTFYGALAERRFLSTQYMRHHSVPFYTPEPDIVHELVGHANMLASPMFAALYQAAGLASRRATTPTPRSSSSAGCSGSRSSSASCGKAASCARTAPACSRRSVSSRRSATRETRPLDIVAMGTLDYDITQYQPVLFAASSFNEVVDVAGAFFESFDDEVAEKYLASAQ